MKKDKRHESKRVLVLTEEPLRDPEQPGGGSERSRALKELKGFGVKIDADSGGRLLVVEASDEALHALEENVPGLKAIDFREGFEGDLGDVDAQDQLFARALAIRVSPEYRELKANQKPGETAEEQLLLSGPCGPAEG